MSPIKSVLQLRTPRRHSTRRRSERPVSFHATNHTGMISAASGVGTGRNSGRAALFAFLACLAPIIAGGRAAAVRVCREDLPGSRIASSAPHRLKYQRQCQLWPGPVEHVRERSCADDRYAAGGGTDDVLLNAGVKVRKADFKILLSTKDEVKQAREAAEVRQGRLEQKLAPFTDISMADYLLKELPEKDNPVDVYQAADAIGNALPPLQARVPGRLCQIAEAVESHFGLPVLNDPPDDEVEIDLISDDANHGSTPSG